MEMSPPVSDTTPVAEGYSNSVNWLKQNGIYGLKGTVVTGMVQKYR